jgi:two-component system, chemotaxis family, chemotaxis protein CheY
MLMRSDLNILLVDDSPNVLELTTEFIKELGFEKIYTARDGTEAFDRIRLMHQRGGKFDLVISDWEMPKMDGLALLKKIRQNESLKNIPFIILTANDKREHVLKAVQAGTNNYIVKPVDPEILDIKINDTLKT